jgi:glycosyltransferase involved in cell wall biosynthesis
MRIALVNNFFLPRTSGSAYQTAQLAETMADRGHEVLVVTAAQGAKPGEFRVGGYRVARLSCVTLPPLGFAMRYDVNFALSPRNIRRVYALLDDFAPDVLHQHGQFFDITWMSGLWARSRHCPVALTVHTPLMHTNRVYSLVMRTADVLFIRNLLRAWSPQLIATDAFMRDYVTQRYGLHNDQVVVIPLGVEAARLRDGNGERVREKLGIGGRPMILSLGHVIPLRNRLLLVESLPYLLDACPDAVLVVVGSANDGRFLRRASELNVLSHVIATGPVPYGEVPSYIAAANVECHEEGLGSGLGTATLEVMAAGTPIVAVANPECFVGITLRNGTELVLVGKNDPKGLATAIGRLLGDPPLARSIGEGGRALVERHFTFEISADRHLKLYESLIAPPAPQIQNQCQ